MKKTLKKILIVAVAVACAFSVHITVNAQAGIGDNTGLGNVFGDLIDQIINGLNPDSTTVNNPDNPSEADPNVPVVPNAPIDPNATTDPNAATALDTTMDPVNNSGTGIVPSSSEQTVYYPPANTTLNNNYNNNQYPVTPQLTTTEPSGDDEMSFTYDSSLSGLLEADSAAIIVQTPKEPYTIGGIIENNGGNDDDDFSWQKIALIAAAGLFVILAALVVALLIQRSKKNNEDAYTEVRMDYNSDEPSGPVAVEVMTSERIAELLGSASGRNGRNNAEGSREDSAAAIRTAALMEQLTHSYSDPLIRKYTEEPVRISPLANISVDGDVSAADILEATNALLDDITGNEKYAADISGISVATDNIDDILNDTEVKFCQECQSPVKSGDVFCHSCGAYID